MALVHVSSAALVLIDQQPSRTATGRNVVDTTPALTPTPPLPSCGSWAATREKKKHRSNENRGRKKQSEPFLSLKGATTIIIIFFRGNRARQQHVIT